MAHRDVKPADVLMANDGRVLLGDFGIASLEGSSAITMTGEVVGSPEFLAPERTSGRGPGPASDPWSLGALLYAAVEGVSPFRRDTLRRDTPLSTLRAVVEDELPPPRRAGPLAPVLEGLLRKAPAGRLSAAEAAPMLRVVGAGGTVRDPGGPAAGPNAATTPLYGRDPAPGPYGPAPLAPRDSAPRAQRTRVGLVLTIGIVVLLPAVVVLGRLLLDGHEKTDASGGSVGSGPTGSAQPSTSPTPVPSASPSPSGAPTPAPKVTLYVHTLRGGYRGACPPRPADAPAFTGTIEVDAVPAEVEYRWVTRGGAASNAGWQSVTYEAGGARTRQFDHTESDRGTGGGFADAARLEVRRPARAVSA